MSGAKEPSAPVDGAPTTVEKRPYRPDDSDTAPVEEAHTTAALLAHVTESADVPDGGCLTCDECDQDEGHPGPCDCGHAR